MLTYVSRASSSIDYQTFVRFLEHFELFYKYKYLIYNILFLLNKFAPKAHKSSFKQRIQNKKKKKQFRYL